MNRATPQSLPDGFRVLRRRRRRLRHRRLLLRLDRLLESRRNRRAREACAEQESAAWDSIVRHGILPYLSPAGTTEMSRKPSGDKRLPMALCSAY